MTYGTMQDRIADELARTDLTSQIPKSILSAIAHYERQRFYFNETQFTFSTVANQEYYTSADSSQIPQLSQIDTVRITVNSSTYTLLNRDFAYLEAVQTSSTYTGDPTEYAYYAQQIRLYPIPSAVRTIQISGLQKFTALSATADTNAWMTDAEELIRARAKYDLFMHVIRSPEEALLMREAERDSYLALVSDTTTRVSTGRFRPTSF